MTEFLSALTAGIGIGSIYALVALGYSFIYRTTASFNFAQGQLVTLGSLFAYTLYEKGGLPALVALVAVLVIVGLLGGAVERVAIWPLARRGDEGLTWLISTLGVAVLLTGAAERIWGTEPLGVRNMIGPSVVHIGKTGVATPYIVAVVVALLLAVGVELFQRFTLWGRLMRAVADNRVGVELAGINVVAIGLVAFVIGSAVAGLAGFVIAPVTFANSTVGFGFAILAFAAIAIGGFASHWGALLGGWLVGLVESFGGTYVGLNYEGLIVFGFLLLVLMIKPEGVFTTNAVRRF
jgi:branched-chain amino acid transport system permease protein